MKTKLMAIKQMDGGTKNWLVFLGKTALYLAIMLGLVYLYHFSHVGGGSFIYNQF